jgi:dephospho-CoA kinase
MKTTQALLIGLTGGIGSGKSTVAAEMARLGATVIDADAISRGLTASGGLAIGDIRRVFGPDFVDASGALDRARMRELVFQDPSAKQRLEAIIHPLVSQQTQSHAMAALEAGARCLVFDVPLLVESGRWRARVDAVLVVDCQVSTQIARTMARSALSEQAVQSIVATQATREQRLQVADAVIYNDGISLAELRAQVTELAAGFGLSLTHSPESI